MTTQEIQQYVYDFLYDKGLPHKSIVSIMGNITAESSWSPDLIESGSGIGYGLCQWSYGRRTQLEAYGTDLLHQCNFLWSELTGENRATTGADLQWINPPSSSVTGGISFNCTISQFRASTDTIEFLTTAWCYCWERPAPSTNHLSSTRIPSANTFNTTMTYQGGGTPTGDSIGDVYPKIIASSYNINQLSAEQITYLKTLSTINYIPPTGSPSPITASKMKYTFNHNKRQIGRNFMGNKLTFDNKEYNIKDVRNDGFIILVYGGSLCYNYINPKYIKSNT